MPFSSRPTSALFEGCSSIVGGLVLGTSRFWRGAVSRLAKEYMLSEMALVPHPLLPWWKVLGLDAKRGLSQSKQHLGFITYCHSHDRVLGLCLE